MVLWNSSYLLQICNDVGLKDRGWGKNLIKEIYLYILYTLWERESEVWEIMLFSK